MNCNQGYLDCDKSYANGCEINTGTDQNNCGGCGTVCRFPNAAAATCNAGVCKLASCNVGYLDCDNDPTDTDGCETFTNGDVKNCGKCGGVCMLPNATPACTGGNCTVAACNAGYQNCNNLAVDGCEIGTQTDPNNCGGCHQQCFIPNGLAGCASGNCTVKSCNAGWANCNGLPADGCEISTQTDANNCGGCGFTCASIGKTTCAAGTCS
jgi:hypothetical protein